MKMKIFFLVCFFLALSGRLDAQNVTKVGTTVMGFLKIDVGARAMGMGGAYVANSEDVTGMFWNPAGIARLKNSEAIFSHTNWIADVDFDYAGIAIPLPRIGIIGLNATFLTMDPMERTTTIYPEGTGETFDAGQYAFGIAYGRELTDRFSIGFNVKYINETIRNCSASGFSMDLGTLFTTNFNGMKIGMSISNYGTKMRMAGRELLVQHDIDAANPGNNENLNAQLDTGSFDLPLLFRVGVSMDMLKGYGNSNLILSVDALHPNDDVEYVNIGGEYVYNKLVALRAGYKSLFAERSEEGLSMGAGFIAHPIGMRLTVDYAYRNFGVLKDINMFTLGLAF